MRPPVSPWSVFLLLIPSLPALPAPIGAAEVKTAAVQLHADSENAGYEAYRAMDGDVRTMWHTQFSAEPRVHLCPHPISCGYAYSCGYDHPGATDPPATGTMPLPAGADRLPWIGADENEAEKKAARTSSELFGIAKNPGNNAVAPHALGMDLGAVYTLTGFVYTPRADNANGTYGEYQFYAAKEAVDGEAVFTFFMRGEFAGSEPSYTVTFDEPVAARYLKFVEISSRNGGPFGSVAEFQPIAEGYQFRASGGGQLQPGAKLIARMPDAPDNLGLQEYIDEWNLLAERFKTPLYWDAIKNEVAEPASLILPEDRDPLDVVRRRFLAMLGDNADPRWRKLYEDIFHNAKNKPIDAPAARFETFISLCSMRENFMLNVDSGTNPFTAGDAPKEYLFVKRHRSSYQHMCDQFYGRTQRPGGGLFVLNVETGKVRNLLENSVVESGRLKGQKLDTGSFLSPDVSFDGKKIAFAYVECEGSTAHVDTLDVTRGHWDIGRSYHIFTCNADGSELRQITDGTWNDFDPCWLPNGRIAFISERRNGYLRCGRECPTYTLYDMDPDGMRMRCLSFHETNEWHPSVTRDGKILYTRWDYVDRYGCIVHHPWTTTLDGRDPREVHGNYSHRHRRADAEFDCRAIPGSHKYIATGGPHHGQSYGSIVLIDPHVADDDAMGPVKRLTPDVGFPESQGGGQVYGTPWPLSETFFLCVADFSQQPGAAIPGAQGGPDGRGNDGIYLCDVYGNRTLLYRDPEIACLSPMPLAARPVPHILPTTDDPASIKHEPYQGIREGGRIARREADGAVDDSGKAQDFGTLSLVNVYDSLRPFPEGTKIKELRIIQLLPMSVPSGAPPHEIGVREGSSQDSVNLARWVLGTVPVEEDGSAHFRVPARIEFQFQAIDENGLAVQSMRSSSYVQPGETLSCNGCHEQKGGAATRPAVQPRATLRAASKIKPETVPGAYPFSYPRLVQPVLDKHCVACHAMHSREGAEPKTFSLAKDPLGGSTFYASYDNLAKRYGFTSYGDPLRTTPGRFGARAAPLYKILKEGHYDVQLSEEEMHRIVLWLDCLSNFYGVYEKEGGEAQRRGELAWPTLE